MFTNYNNHNNVVVSFVVVDIFHNSPIWSQNSSSSEFVTGLRKRLKYSIINSRATSTTAGYSKAFQKWKTFAEAILGTSPLPADNFQVA